MRLIIARHGKAERHAPSGLDRDRVLRPRGHRQAAYLGETLAAWADPPVLVVSSPYARAAQTAAHIARALALEPVHDDRLSCSGGEREAIGVIRRHAPEAPTLCIVGHNPTFEDLVARLTGRYPFQLRTGEAGVIELPELDPGHDPVGVGSLVDVIRLVEEDDD